MKNKKGFTLIELVLVIAILAVLAVTALPNIFNISLSTARDNARDAVVGSVQTGIWLYAVDQIAQGNAISYPTLLDAVTADTAGTRVNPLFVNVLQGGVQAGWKKVDPDCYQWTEGGATDFYQYSNTAGTFLYTASTCGS